MIVGRRLYSDTAWYLLSLSYDRAGFRPTAQFGLRLPDVVTNQGLRSGIGRPA